MSAPDAVAVPELHPLSGTIVNYDLERSTDYISALDERYGPAAATLVPRDIIAYKKRAATTVPTGRHREIDFVGDGGSWYFQEAADAHAFAAALHAAAADGNANFRPPAHHYFRVGIATGECPLVEGTEFKPGGMPPNRAARLQANAGTGGICIDRETYDRLPDVIRRRYDGPKRVRGKRREVFEAWRCQAVPPPPRPPRWPWPLAAVAAALASLVAVYTLVRPPAPPAGLAFETWNWGEFRNRYDALGPDERAMLPWVNDRLDGTLNDLREVRQDRAKRFPGQAYFAVSEPVPRAAGPFRLTADLAAAVVEHRADVYLLRGDWPGWEQHRRVSVAQQPVPGGAVALAVADGLKAGDRVFVVLRVFVNPADETALDGLPKPTWRVTP
jgi:class 3 adenylate cyclase